MLALVIALAAAPPSTDPLCATQDWLVKPVTPMLYAWRWCEDPDLSVHVTDDSVAGYERGVHLRYAGHEVEATDVGGVWFPLLDVLPYPGTDPHVDSVGDLNLALLGSGENGCDALGYDDVDVSITATQLANRIRIDMVIDGVVYVLLPPNGTIDYTMAAGWGTINVPLLCSLEADSVISDFETLTATNTSIGKVELSVVDPLPWLQVQGWNDFVEIDMDHSCTEDPSMPRPAITLTTWVVP